MHIQTAAKTPRYQNLEDKHLRFNFQCKDLIEFKDNRHKRQWIYFTDGKSAILGSLYDSINDTDTLLLRRPLGEGMELLAEVENKYCATNKLRIRGLSRDQFIELSGRSLYPYEEEAMAAIQAMDSSDKNTKYYHCKDSSKYIYKHTYGWQNIQDFDPELSESFFSNIRKSVNRAKKDGLQFRSSTIQDQGDLEKLYNTWFHQSIRKGKNIPYRFPEKIADQFETYVVTDKNEEILAWTILYAKDKYANMPQRIALNDISRPADFMDYNIFCLLKEKGVERLDRSANLDIRTLDSYKSNLSFQFDTSIF